MSENNKNNIDSLAAFLHSGDKEKAPAKEQLSADLLNKPALEKKDIHASLPEKPVPARNDAPVSSKDISDLQKSIKHDNAIRNSGSLSDVLFSLDDKKKERAVKKMKTEAVAPAAVVYDDEDDYDEEYEDEYDSIGDNDDIKTYNDSAVGDGPYYKPEDKSSVNYDTAATQMMEIGSVRVNTPLLYDDEETEEEKQERKEIAEMTIRYEKQRLRSRTFAYILLGAFLSVIIIGVSAYISTYIVTFALDLTGIATNDFNIDVIIPEDADTKLVAALLQENNIIKSAKFFSFFADITHKSETFQSGTYTLSSTMSYSTLFKTLQNQSFDYKTVTIRIVEGMTASEIGELLEENLVCRASDFEQYYKNMQNKYNFELRVNEKSTKFNQLEGYLFPDTYEFYAILDIPEIEYDSPEDEKEAADKQRENEIKYAKEAAEKMYKNFDEKVTKSMYKQMGEMDMTLDEVVTLASMVQREAASTEDMYYVASVFLNRIRNIREFPHLQSDVTVLYVENDIKPYIDGGSTRYTRLANAYNTYVCNGIPAGPICNPGLDAINAVLNSAQTDYYYFCANSETGEVYYASTHEEHEANLVLAGLTSTPDTEEEND